MKQFCRAFTCAFAGIKNALKKGRNLKIHLSVAFIVILLGLFLGITPNEWLILILTMATVISAEIFNSVIENVCDLLKEENHLGYERTGFIRDASAGAVLILALGSILIGLIIFLPYL
ncbi:MAG: diacylglycerol kinase family protein [Candidatus Marinimicrobia bacterium]|nr:diacylglycerol kinase family protein [Candidatus Neomarinimicrobiota bacterium]